MVRDVSRAVVITAAGGPERLSVVQVHTPEPAPDEVLVEVEVAGLNFLDVMHRSGAHGDLDGSPERTGVEAAGTVVAVGSSAQGIEIGQRVVWTGVAGSHATHVSVPADAAVPIPADVTSADAVAVFSQGLTAQYLAEFAPPETPSALVWAAAGGVGRLLVQMLTGRGGRVVGAVSSPRKQRAAIEAGAVRATDYASAVRVARELTDGTGVDVVYDSVGAPTLDDSLAAVRTRGIVVVYGSAGGPVPPLDISRLGAAGSIMLARTRLAHFTSDRAELMGRSARLFDDLRRGQVTLELFATFGLDGIADAHRAIESRSTIGKILLTP